MKVATLTEEMNLIPTADVTMEEVKTATFQIGAHEALDQDGLNGQFYQHP